MGNEDIPSLKAAYLTLIAGNLESCEVPFDCEFKLYRDGHLFENPGVRFILSASISEDGVCGFERNYSIEFESGLAYYFTADASRWSHHGNKLELSLGNDDFFKLID